MFSGSLSRLSLKSSLWLATASAGLLLVAAPLKAHHSFAAEYDATKVITLEGTITRIDFVNPHVWVYIDVKGPDGKMANWAVEAGAPNALIRRGWKPGTVPIGTQVVVVGYRAKSGGLIANGGDIRFPSGRVMFLGSSGTGAPYDGRDK